MYKRGIRVCTGTGIGASLSTCIQNPNWYNLTTSFKEIDANCYKLGSSSGLALIKTRPLAQQYLALFTSISNQNG
jgi:hypothetical protein